MNAQSVAPRRRRAAGFGAIAVAAALVTSACAAGRAAQTANQVPSQDGVNATVRTMALRGLAIDAPTGSNYYVPGSAVALKLVLVNNATSTDALTSISTTAASGWGAYSTISAGNSVRAAASASAAGATSSAQPSAGPTPSQSVPVEAGGRTSFGTPEATGSLLLLGTKGKLYPGNTVSITFTFARAGTITVPVPIELSDTPGEQTVEPPAGASDSG